jgi:hypothetical protein
MPIQLRVSPERYQATLPTWACMGRRSSQPALHRRIHYGHLACVGHLSIGGALALSAHVLEDGLRRRSPGAWPPETGTLPRPAPASRVGNRPLQLRRDPAAFAKRLLIINQCWVPPHLPQLPVGARARVLVEFTGMNLNRSGHVARDAAK